MAIPLDEDYADQTQGTVYAGNNFVLDGIRYVLSGTGGVTYESMIDTGGISSGFELLFDYTNATPDGAGGLLSVTISAADGSAFSLAGISFLIYNLGSHGPSSDVTLTSSQGGSLGPYATNGSLGNVQHLNLSGNAAFQTSQASRSRAPT